jgi:hypothetical protein
MADDTTDTERDMRADIHALLLEVDEYLSTIEDYIWILRGKLRQFDPDSNFPDL